MRTRHGVPASAISGSASLRSTTWLRSQSTGQTDLISRHSMCLDVSRRSQIPRWSIESTVVSAAARRLTPCTSTATPRSHARQSHLTAEFELSIPMAAGAAAPRRMNEAYRSLAGLHPKGRNTTLGRRLRLARQVVSLHRSCEGTHRSITGNTGGWGCNILATTRLCGRRALEQLLDLLPQKRSCRASEKNREARTRRGRRLFRRRDRIFVRRPRHAGGAALPRPDRSFE